jgi:hypothetical protein
MPDEYDAMPLAEAERRLREEIEARRADMERLGLRRAQLVHAEVTRRGRGGAVEVAAELDLGEEAVRRLLRIARGDQARRNESD